jgi:YHS domain-containing protein
MTAQRQERNGKLRPAVLGLGIALISLWAALGPHAPRFASFSGFAAHAATTERVVVNRFSGLAIEGFDPVAYFIEQQPVLGSPDFEASQAGAVWRFRNEGNRASFRAHPEVYGPQFGGYDPVDVARGVTFAGNPRFWVISDERLYLFGLEAHRDEFATNPEEFLAQAQARWPKLEQGLSQ